MQYTFYELDAVNKIQEDIDSIKRSYAPQVSTQCSRIKGKIKKYLDKNEYFNIRSELIGFYCHAYQLQIISELELKKFSKYKTHLEKDKNFISDHNVHPVVYIEFIREKCLPIIYQYQNQWQEQDQCETDFFSISDERTSLTYSKLD